MLYFCQLKHFHDGIYWSSVTIATVGYGDISPQTNAGKLVVVLTIILVITVLPYQTNELVTLLTKHSVYERATYSTFTPGKHIVIAGSLTPVAFKDFIEEFYHKDHGYEDRDIVILSPNPPERSLEILVRYQDHIAYIQGSPMIRKVFRTVVFSSGVVVVGYHSS